MKDDILKAIIGWGVPILGTWLLAKIPAVRDWLASHSFARTALFALLFAVLCSLTAVELYDRYVVQPQFAEIKKTLFEASDAVVPAVDNRCPPGSYAVGIRTVSVSGGAHGFLESATLNCMQLRFKPK
jgi:hypothetical protein